MRWRSGARWWAVGAASILLAGCGGPAVSSPPATSTPTGVSVVSPSGGSGSPSATPTGSTGPSRTASTAGPSPSQSSAAPSSAAPPSGAPLSAAPSADRPVIVIDPGHSGRSIRSRTTNGLLDFDYPNTPEITEMFDISTCLAQGLRADGYRVIMTKQHADDSVSLTERARIANRAKADLAVSLHDDHSQGPSFQATYSQRGVPTDGRYPTMYRGSGSRRTVFDHPSVAAASDRAARIIARERTEAQGRPVTVRQNSFTGRPPLEPGNLALVQLLADVPWVYNEAGALTDGSTTRRLSVAAETGYAKGVLDGIEAAVPLSGRTRTTSADQLSSCLAARR